MNNEWYTPKDLFDEWDSVFHFTLDPCACEESHLCDKYYTKEQDGLSKDWSGEIVFMNPPYDRTMYKWIQKALYENICHGVTVVCLLPARTDTHWFHEFCMKGEIYFIRGRLKFSGAKYNAPFPSMIVVFR